MEIVRGARNLVAMGLVFVAASSVQAPSAGAQPVVVEFVQGPGEGAEAKGEINIGFRAKGTRPLRALVITGRSLDFPTQNTAFFQTDEFPSPRPVSARLVVGLNTLPVENGRYELKASAVFDGGTASVTRTLSVNNEPPAPLDPGAGLHNGVVAVFHRRCNVRPDFVSFVVERSAAAAAFGEVGRMDTSLVFYDRTAPPGTQLRYRLREVRRSPIDAQGLRSGPSSASREFEIPVTPDPRPLPMPRACEAKIDVKFKSVELSTGEDPPLTTSSSQGPGTNGSPKETATSAKSTTPTSDDAGAPGQGEPASTTRPLAVAAALALLAACGVGATLFLRRR